MIIVECGSYNAARDKGLVRSEGKNMWFRTEMLSYSVLMYKKWINEIC